MSECLSSTGALIWNSQSELTSQVPLLVPLCTAIWCILVRRMCDVDNRFKSTSFILYALIRLGAGAVQG